MARRAAERVAEAPEWLGEQPQDSLVAPVQFAVYAPGHHDLPGSACRLLEVVVVERADRVRDLS
jgi:hypothetical protein